MREVVKKEVLKPFKAGVMYPVSNSEWVGQVKVVPKKGGISIITSPRGELRCCLVSKAWSRVTDVPARRADMPLQFGSIVQRRPS
jgi:hypothetical protein